jgi:hypothetical protein
MAPRLATQQGKDQSSKSTTSWDAYVGKCGLDSMRESVMLGAPGR